MLRRLEVSARPPLLLDANDLGHSTRPRPFEHPCWRLVLEDGACIEDSAATAQCGRFCKIRQSLLISVSATLASMVLGVPLGVWLANARFPGRGPVGVVGALQTFREDIVELRLVFVENIAAARHEHLESKPGQREELLVRQESGPILLDGELDAWEGAMKHPQRRQFLHLAAGAAVLPAVQPITPAAAQSGPPSTREVIPLGSASLQSATAAAPSRPASTTPDRSSVIISTVVACSTAFSTASAATPIQTSMIRWRTMAPPPLASMTMAIFPVSTR